MLSRYDHHGQNALLAFLGANVTRAVGRHGERVTLSNGHIVSDTDQPIEFAYFPVTSVISILSPASEDAAVETSVVGPEGMSPLGAIHGVRSCVQREIVQTAGDAWRMSRDSFDKLSAEFPEFRGATQRFAHALFAFASQTSACHRSHSVVQQCARWLLTTHDRVRGDGFPLTHVFLSQMLGVRRSSVTIAAETLRDAGAISYSRGHVRISDRGLLELQSCGCYGIIKRAYSRLLDNEFGKTAGGESPIRAVASSPVG